MFFPVSGVEVNPLIPPLVSFLLAFFGAMCGVSGAFLLLPFQMSVLGYTAPGVSSTNLLYNVIGTPAGVLRYIRERRMFWPLVLVLLTGMLPGIILGIYIRLRWLNSTDDFRIFAGLVLLYLGVNMVRDICRKRMKRNGHNGSLHIEKARIDRRTFSATFQGEEHHFSTMGILAICFAVGILSGMYGMGGAGILAPFFVGVMGLPVYLTAGATLLANCVTSAVGVVSYGVAGSVFGVAQAAPDWMLGLLFGAGGFAGMYLGARCQRFVPSIFIKVLLAAATLYVGVRYALTAVP
jgi:hypothetical protein